MSLIPIIYKSPYQDVTNFAKTGIFEYLFVNNPKIKLSAPALIDAENGAVTTYAQLIEESLRFGDGLQRVAGLYPGSTMLIFSPNTALYPVLMFAGQAAGLTVSTANSGYTSPELAHQLRDSSASVMLVSLDLLATAIGAAKECNFDLQRIYVLPGTPGLPSTVAGDLLGCKSYESLRGRKEFKPVVIPVKDLTKRVAFLPYSSGTTSRPKGVEISHANITSVSLQLNKSKDLFDKKEVVMGVLPLYHIYGLIVLLHQTLSNGGTIILLPKFDLIKFCAAVQKYRGTVALIVPPIALGLAKHPAVANYDLSSLRFFMSGAAPLSAALQSTLEKRLGGKTKALQGYGMTETTSVALLPDMKDLVSGTCGKLLSTVEARLVSTDTGLDVAEGESGELWLRGPNMMLAYHNNLKATQETITPDGWMLTGDVCVRTPTGNYIIVDRSKELIKYSGFQVPPAELEAVLLTCPMVADCAVIGVWSEERATELPRAYVVVEEKYTAQANVLEEIGKFVERQVASHKKLRGGVYRIDVIPKSAAGKILRKELRTLAAKETETGSKL